MGAFFMHLLLGYSCDATADMIVDGLPADKVIRVNNDRPHDHEVTQTPEGFLISDRFGRIVNHETLDTVILRKMTYQEDGMTGEELYARREFTKAIEGILDWIERFKPSAMPVSHRAMSRATKFACSTLAAKHFSVPDWAFTTAPSKSNLKNPVLKNLCGLPVEAASLESEGKMLYVQDVRLDELADGWPWFIQEKVSARYDLTVLYMGGKCRALRLDRSKFEGLDWRKFIGTGLDEQWEEVRLSHDFVKKIDLFMKDVGIRFGRLDYLYTAEDMSDIQFLEVNPHGQWGWMDLDQTRGIYKDMMSFLTTPCFEITSQRAP